MTATFELPAALHGKQVMPVMGTIDITVSFNLWKDQTELLDPSTRATYWHDLSLLENTDVKVELLMQGVVVDSKIFKNFETVTMHGTFNDELPDTCQLQVKIINLNKLLVRDDHGSFVAPMIHIELLKLQGVEILHLLENTIFNNDETIVNNGDTIFSKDAELRLNFETPVYPWMLKNREKILPDFFNLSMIDI